jgi:hypothetical protein
VATVSPSLITLTASSAETIFPFFIRVGGVGESMGWDTSFSGIISFTVYLPVSPWRLTNELKDGKYFGSTSEDEFV